MSSLHKGIVVWESSYWNVLDTLKGIGPFKMSDWQATSHKYNFIHKAKSQNPAAAFPQPFSDAHLAAPHSGRLALWPPTLPRCIGLSSLITGPVTNQGHWRRLIPPVPTTYLVHSFFIRTATHTSTFSSIYSYFLTNACWIHSCTSNIWNHFCGDRWG